MTTREIPSFSEDSMQEESDAEGSSVEENASRSLGTRTETMQNNTQSCVLCELTGSGHVVVDEVNTYILENIGRVNLQEMAQQVTFAINAIPGKYLSRDMFHEHIRSHMRQQKVVLSGILHDLLEIAQSTKEACSCVCSETNTRVVDAKMLQAYLKTLDSIMAIYRSEAMKERRD